MENQWAPKLARFERGVDMCLVLLIYDALQTVKLQLQPASSSTRSKICSSACSIHSFGLVTATIVTLGLKGIMNLEMLSKEIIVNLPRWVWLTTQEI